MYKLLIILACFLVSLLAFNYYTSAANKEYFSEIVAINPNQFIQNDQTNSANNIDNQMSSQFLPDNMDLSQFFKFDKKTAKYYPDSKNIVNVYNEVPRII